MLDKTERKRHYNTLASIDYEFYVQYTNDNYRHGEHTKYICSILQKAVDEKNKRLIISMPPQHSKSYTITETLPSYYLGTNKNDRVIVTGYSNTFAQRFGRRNKEKIKKYGNDIFGIQLNNKTADSEWNIKGKGKKTYQGRMLSSGLGGQITGEGANLLIIDDPIKNRQEANSKTYRDRIWNEWESTLSTRLAEDAVVIVIMTRWHEDDLAGRLIENEGFEYINLPALAEENDIIDREEGQALWPWKYSRKYLETRKERLSAKVWNSLYQGKPSIEEGTQFKSSYYQYFSEKANTYILHSIDEDIKVLKNKCIVFQTIDTAIKTGKKNDYTVISTWALTLNHTLLLLNVYRARVEVPDLYNILISQRLRWNARIQFVEDKASGSGLIQKARKKGKPVIPLKADTDKITRSFDISTMYENGMVFHKKGTAWINDYEDELNKFPDGAHDDMADTASYAGIIVERGLIRLGSSRGFASST